MIDVHALKQATDRLLPNTAALAAVARAYAFPSGAGTMPPLRPSAVPSAEQCSGAQRFEKPDLIAAVLASAVIKASGKPHTTEEAVAVWLEVRDALAG